MVTVDWEDPEVRAIIACLDGKEAWQLLLAYLSKRPKRLELRDAIWARRREVMPKRKVRRLLALRTVQAAAPRR